MLCTKRETILCMYIFLVQYQQQQLRDFSMEYEQKMAVVWRYLEAEEASRK